MFQLNTIKLAFFTFALLIASYAYAEQAEIHITIEGMDKDKTTLLLNGLSLQRQKDSPRLNPTYIEKLYKSGIEELTTMLTAYGYYDATITGEVKKTETGWDAHYDIDPGQPVIISYVDLQITGEAKDDPEFQKLIKKFPLQAEQQLEHSAYEAAKKSILTLAASRGYFDGEYRRSEVEVEPDNYSATVYLHYDSGERYLFQELHFPETVIGETLLNKMVPFKTGNPYQDKEMLKLRRNLSDSGYFDSVSIRVDHENSDGNTVPLDISLDEKAKHQYTAGVGYGTDTGARLALGWENRYVNKRGHRIDASARLSQISNTVSAGYTMPYWSDTIDQIGFTTEYEQEDTDTADRKTFTLGGYYQRERWGWEEIGSLRLLQESYQVSEDDESVFLVIPGISWSRTWADNTLYTRHGGKLSLSLSAASDSLLSDVTFGQAVVRGKYIRSIGKKGRFITRAEVGITEVNDFSKMPSSLRFFAGGDTSIRGFDYESLGPLGDDGEVVGARYMAVGSLEYEHMFVKNWGAAVFTDFGNAFNDFSDPIEQSVGAGIRWRSPVGLIRVDLAQAITEPGEPLALHIVIGPDL